MFSYFGLSIHFIYRNEDSHHFFDDKTNEIHSNKKFQKLWLDQKYEYVDDPTWTCNSEETCLQPEFHQGYISGDQYRTKSCFWGGQPCLGTDQEQKHEDWCDGAEIEVCPLEDETFGSYKETQVGDQLRTIRSSPDYFVDMPAVAGKIQKCDRGSWTYWLEWKIETESEHFLKRSKRRYCLYQNECLFEEKVEQKCCLEPNSCSNTNITCFQEPLCPFTGKSRFQIHMESQ